MLKPLWLSGSCGKNWRKWIYLLLLFRWRERGGSRAGFCLFSKSTLTYCFSSPQRVAAGWTEDGESGLFADQLSKCTLWSVHKFPDLCLGDTLHMSQPHSLWSLHHLFLNFQYIFSSSSKSCKELAAKLKQEGNSPADKEPILALVAVECGAPVCSAASRAAPVFSCQRSSANAFRIAKRVRSQDGKLRGEARVAKVGWPKRGVDTSAKWLRASPGRLPHPGLWLHRAFAAAAGGCGFPREPGSP